MRFKVTLNYINGGMPQRFEWEFFGSGACTRDDFHVSLVDGRAYKMPWGKTRYLRWAFRHGQVHVLEDNSWSVLCTEIQDEYSRQLAVSMLGLETPSRSVIARNWLAGRIARFRVRHWNSYDPEDLGPN